MPFVLSPNMSLPVPTVGNEPSPTYAFDVNAALTIVDAHNHSPGSGVQITPPGLNINTSLTFNDNPATNLSAASFFTQSADSSTAGTVYTKLGSEVTPLTDLFYFDGSNVVQLTSGGLVNATIASIPGESYSGGTFTWVQGSGSTTPANFDIGSITIRPNVAMTTNGVTLNPPSGISSAYNLALPLIPLSTSFLQIDNTGSISAGPAIANGITSSNIAATNYTISGNSGTFSTTSATPTTVTGLTTGGISVNGRPVMIMLTSHTGGSFIGVTSTSGSSPAVLQLVLERNGSPIATINLTSSPGSTPTGSVEAQWPPASFSHFDVPGSGSFAYSVLVAAPSGGTVFVNNVQLAVCELL